MKITLDGLDGRNFTLRLPRDAGGEHVVALHDTRALRGLYAHDATRFSLDPVEADALTGDVAWVLAEGTLHLGGPAVLGATRLDLEIRRDDAVPGVTGAAHCAALDAPVTRLRRGAMELYGGVSGTALDARYDAAAGGWTLATETLGARGFSLAQGSLHARLDRADARSLSVAFGGGTALRAEALTLEGLSLTLDGLTVRAAGATVEGLRLLRDGAGETTVEAARVSLTGVEVARGEVSARAPSLRLEALRQGPEGLSLSAVVCDELAVGVHGLGARRERPEEEPPKAAPEATNGRRTLGVDLPFLDGLAGRLEADVVVDVKLPVIERRVATHRLRLDVRDGAIDFKQLEGGLSSLEDAVIDFEVDAAGLYLEVDAVVVKRELARWPLDPDGLRLARQRRVKLRAFAQPTVAAAAPSPRGDTEKAAPVALRRVEVKRLFGELTARGASTMRVGEGTLRLGGEAGFVGALRVSGELAHDTSGAGPETALAVTLEGLDLGVDGVDVGGRRLDLARARVGQVTEGRVTLRGLTPTSVTATLRAVELTGLRVC